jgi:hypothetical protein
VQNKAVFQNNPTRISAGQCKIKFYKILVNEVATIFSLQRDGSPKEPSEVVDCGGYSSKPKFSYIKLISTALTLSN